jgi:putative endopeptidase
MMVIPAGILRAPFFDLKKSDAWNLGGIGSAIGHEITHGFDIDGRMYDSAGNYKNWWTKKDEANYDKLTQKLVELFDGTDYMKGQIDGELTLSENLSDLGGMAIALEALNDILKKETEKENRAAKTKAYREFFTSYAISWRNKDRPQKAREALFTNSHAPAKFRVNKIVGQFAEFYEAFGIDEKHSGWIDPKDRLALW